MAKTVKILSIDGGGIRGVIPAMLVAELEKRVGLPAARMFDLIAGTSTGGILALGLTAPDSDGQPRYSADDLVDLYAEQGERIFSRSLWHRMRAAGSLREEKYPADGLESVLREYLGETRLREAVAEILVTSYEIERRVPWFFRRRRAQEDPDEYDFSMVQVARATSAAPTYFEPMRIQAGGTAEYWALVDGGVYANNPTMCALVDAVKTHGKDNDYLVVSLGTGELTRPLWFEEVRDWGLLMWARPILSVVFDGVSDTVAYQVDQLCPVGDDNRKRSYRFQTELVIGNDDMDDASRTNIRALKLRAEELIAERAQDLDVLCEQLSVGQIAGA